MDQVRYALRARRTSGRFRNLYRGELRAAPGVTYATQFIGTRRGWDTTSTPVRDSTGRAVTRRYSRDVGAVLAEVTGTSPSYALRGDELYVRSRIVSSRRKANGYLPNEVEMAWTQPVRP